MKWIILVAAFALSGCIFIETNVQPVNPAVKATATGKDCSPIFVGLGYGVNTVERAMRRGLIDVSASGSKFYESAPITKLHSVAVTEFQFLIFGERCIKVEGE